MMIRILINAPYFNISCNSLVTDITATLHIALNNNRISQLIFGRGFHGNLRRREGPEEAEGPSCS